MFSLAVHVALLFFIRFVPPTLENLAREPALLNVILESRDNWTLIPADIPLASQESAGEAKIGVQDKGIVARAALHSLAAAAGDQASAETPQGSVQEKILAVDRPQPFKVEQPAARSPELPPAKPAGLAPPMQPEEKNDSLAPLPSVAKPVVAAEPAAQKLASSELLRGERQDKIALVGQPRDTTAPEQPAPEHTPKPAGPAKQVAREEPIPAKVEEARLDRAEEPKPHRAEAPQPAKVTESKAPPSVADGMKPEGGHAKAPGFETPVMALPGIPLIRKIAPEESKHAPSGERRKTISAKEQDFRYAMYIEGLRLKLERIGSLNYPVAAAGGHLSGTLSVKIAIRADGSLENVSIARPSKEGDLNAGAEKIVRMSAPFSPLPEGIRRETDILIVTIRWTFSNSRQMFD